MNLVDVKSSTDLRYLLIGEGRGERREGRRGEERGEGRGERGIIPLLFELLFYICMF